MTTGKYDIYSKDFDLEDCMAQAQQKKQKKSHTITT